MFVTVVTLYHVDNIFRVAVNVMIKQYIGETKRRLKDRFNEHRRPVDKQTNSSKPTTVSEHFLCNNHNATDMQLIFLLNSLNLIVTGT